MKRNTATKFLLVAATSAVLLTGTVGCNFGPGGGGTIGGTTSSNKITILTKANVGTPTTANDPYKKYILDNYGLDATLNAATDFNTTVQLAFADYNSMPDIVSFSDINTFRSVFNQGVLLSDWTPYLSEMPNFSKIVNAEDADRPGQPSVARLMLTAADGLAGLWTLPDPPTWSLKIREDWAKEYRATTVGGTHKGQAYPAGNVATDGGPWQPKTPDDLLNFARWVVETKNTDSKSPTYAFATVGERKDFGVLGTWVPLMYGAVTQLPYGLYFTESGEVQYGITDGTHIKMLDFIKTLISEELINTNWYYDAVETKNTLTNSGHVAIDWYPGEISENTQAYMVRNDIKDASGEIVDTTDWWQTYPVPKDPACENGGYQASDGFFGQIITVSAKTANDTEKMKKICAFLDDLAMTKTTAADGTVTYNRSDAYNALRWGVGIESDLQFQSIPGSSRVYLYTGDVEGRPRAYRSEYPGAWDWGAFFRSTDDGVVQGSSSEEVTRIVERVIEQDALTASYPRRLQYGGVLNLDTGLVSTLSQNMQRFEYSYVMGTASQSYDAFKTAWLDAGGTDILADALAQFKRLGFINQ